MIRHPLLVTIALLSGTFIPAAHGADATTIDDVADLLDGRWFETEIVLFEHLRALDTNNPETLIRRDLRSWPNSMIALSSVSPPPARQMQTGAFVDDGAIAINNPETDVTIPALSQYQIVDRIRASLARSSQSCFGFLGPDESIRSGRLAGDTESSDPLAAAVAPAVFDAIHPDLVATLEPPQIVPFPPPQIVPVRPRQIVPLPPIWPIEAPLEESPIEIALPEPGIESTNLLRLLADVAAFEDELQLTSLTWLDDDELTLTNAVKAINRQNDLRPIFHGRWRQHVPPRESPTQLHFTSSINADAPATMRGLARIEGIFSLSVARYLHFEPMLWFHGDALGLDPVLLPLPSMDALDHIPNVDDLGYMQMRESRRLRSGELHYLDHPKMGLIVRIDRVPIPDHLTRDWRALVAESKAREGSQ